MENSFKKKSVFLLLSIFLTASCALLYELLIASICSYFLGDSVKYFSLVIGIFVFSMGVGSYITRFIREDMLFFFFNIEILLGVIGGLSIPALYAAFAWTNFFSVLAFTLTFIIGFLIGFEIPLVTRELSGQIKEEKNLSNVLSLDYLGGLCATLLFPFVFVPYLGLYKTSLIAGLVNVSIGIFGFVLYQESFKRKKTLLSTLAVSFFCVILLASLVMSKRLLDFWETSLYRDVIVHSEQSKYQKIVVTAKNRDIRLYLNGNLQFSSQDEYRYHESLVHIPMGLAKNREKVLILGGGDGMAVREILKYKDVAEITVVDLDKNITDLAKNQKLIRDLNKGSLNNKKVRIVNDDAFMYLASSKESYNIIFADLPDPNNLSLAKLYSKEFFKLILRNLLPDGIYTGQSTSPYYSKDAFWCIRESMTAAGFPNTYPYHLNIPSFGEWGFIMASRDMLDPKEFRLTVGTRFLSSNISHMFFFEKDLLVASVQESSLDSPAVLAYYLDGWENFK